MMGRFIDTIWNSKWFFAIGGVLLLGYCLGPIFYSVYHMPDGVTWIPYNAPYKYCSDIVFYGAATQEYRESFCEFKNPVSETATPIYYDLFRAASQRLAALLTFFIEDHRVGMLLSLCLGVLLQYILLYIIFFRFFKKSFPSFMGAFFVIFAASLTIPTRGIAAMTEHLFNFSGFLTFDTLNSHFRYVALHTAAVFMWLHILSVSIFHDKKNNLNLIFFAVSFFLTIYSYYAFALFAGVLTTIYWLSIYSKQSSKKWWTQALIFTGIVVFLCVITNTFQNINDLLTLKYKSEIVTQSHLEDIAANIQYLQNSVQLVLRSFIIVLIAFYFSLIAKTKNSIFFVLTLSLFLIYFIGLVLDKHYVIYRFHTRGFSSIMSFVIVFAILVILSKMNSNKILRYLKMGFIVTFMLFFYFSSAGFVKMIEGLYNRDSYYIPKSDWTMYEYIQQKLPKNTLMLALDPSDNALLPMYTHVDLVVSDPSFSTESMANNIDNLLGATRFLKIPEQVLLNLLDDYKIYGDGYICAPRPTRSSYLESYSHHFWNQYLYLAYIKTAYGVYIFDYQHRRFTPQFVDIIKTHYNSALNSHWSLPKGAYLLVDFNVPIYKTYSNENFELVFKTETKGLYVYNGIGNKK